MRHAALHPLPSGRAQARAAAALPVLTVLAVLAAVATLAVAGTGARPAAAATLGEHFDRTFPLAAGGALVIGNTNGSVILEAWDRNEVRVQADKRVKADSDAEAKRVMDQLRIAVDVTAGRVHIDTKYPENHGFLAWLFGGGHQASVEYHVQVPRRLELAARTVNGGVHLAGAQGRIRLETTNGSLQVAGAAGPLVLETTNGNIDVRQSAGEVRAATTNGSVEVALTRLDGRVGLETTNGSVTLRLPRDVRASLDAGTTNGSVHTDLPVAASSTSRRHIQGSINGGGTELRLSTTNGSVRILNL